MGYVNLFRGGPTRSPYGSRQRDTKTGYCATLAKEMGNFC
jgi:hypothetical protein